MFIDTHSMTPSKIQKRKEDEWIIIIIIKKKTYNWIAPLCKVAQTHGRKGWKANPFTLADLDSNLVSIVCCCVVTPFYSISLFASSIMDLMEFIMMMFNWELLVVQFVVAFWFCACWNSVCAIVCSTVSYGDHRTVVSFYRWSFWGSNAPKRGLQNISRSKVCHTNNNQQQQNTTTNNSSFTNGF